MTEEVDEGQATVEVALVLPLLAVLLLAIVQIGIVVNTQLRTTHAAREGARAASVGDSASATVAKILGDGTSVSQRTADSSVAVTVQSGQVRQVPLIGGLLGDFTVSATASMRIEADP